MTMFSRLAITAILALATAEAATAQNFGQMFVKNNPATPLGAAQKPDGVAKAVYTTLSDMQGQPDAQQVAYESISDAATQAVTARVSDAGVAQIPATGPAQLSTLTGVNDGGVTQASLIGPTCGAAGCTVGPGCGLPGAPSCGLAEPGCGVPSVGATCGLPSDPSCGLASGPGCGLPSVGASCGLPSVLGDPSCGAAGGCDSCGGCGQIACGSLCTRKCPDCCGVGTHYSRIYGEALYMRARNAEVAYAVPVDGPIAAGQPAPVQIGNVGLVDSDYELGFRAGVNLALDTVSSIDVRYTLWESLTENETSAIAPFALRSLVTHPATATAAQDALSSIAQLEIDMDIIDVSYRHLLKCCEVFSANYVIGARYAKLEQQFDVEFLKLGSETVSTDIDFDGAGLRLGLETERYSCRNQFHVYANGYASFLAGRFRAHYAQGQAFDQSVVDSEWEAGRIVPIIDFEAGVGWTSISGKCRVNAGYMVSGWFNTVTTPDYITAIQTNDFRDLTNSMWFDGLQARVSWSF